MNYSHIKFFSNIHVQGHKPNIFLFSAPRSGSTWLMELIGSQAGIKCINEPFNLRDLKVRKALDIHDWQYLYDPVKSYEKFEDYIAAFERNSFRTSFKNPNPRSKIYHFKTDRIIYKILHAGEEKISWFKKRFNGVVVYLIRHPIPTSLSRKQMPRLDTFINSDYNAFFTYEQIKYAKDIAKKGSLLDHAVLDWCFQNALPLKNQEQDWLLITYEQLVLEPNKMAKRLTEFLQLNESKKIIDGINIASSTTYQSDIETQKFFATEKMEDKAFLINKWQEKITKDEERRVFDIVKAFDISIYKENRISPVEKYLL